MTFFQDLKSTFRWFIVFSFGGKVTLTGFLADCSLLGAKETVRVSNLMYPKWDCSWFTLTTFSQKIHWPARAYSATITDMNFRIKIFNFCTSNCTSYQLTIYLLITQVFPILFIVHWSNPLNCICMFYQIHSFLSKFNVTDSVTL